jgi:secondary thiamine-phosphate synthase enzyme
MIVETLAGRRPPARRRHREELVVDTPEGVAFIDITDAVGEVVRRSGIDDGLVSIQSLHTTAAVVVNEKEPLLLEDLRDLLERLAPRARQYRHDDFTVRTVNLQPNEPANGHAHAKALFLRTSETLAVEEGRPRLGRWQRIFLVELDRPRERHVVVTVLRA